MCSLALFGSLMGAIYVLRPGLVFRPDGELYEFGTGQDRSIFPLGVLTVAAAVVSSFVFAMVDLVTPPACPRGRPGVVGREAWASLRRGM